MEIFIFWIISGCAASYVAGQKNRSSGNWFLLGLLLGPIALLMVGLSPAAPDRICRSSPRPGSSYPMVRPCPFCAEDIKPEAIACKHCQRDVPPMKIKSKIELAYESMQQAHEHKVSKSGAKIWLSAYGFADTEIEAFLSTMPGS